MRFHEFGDKNNPAIMLIHGGGNSWWSYLRQARVLAENYFVILPTLDGHGEEYITTYVSTQHSADKLIKYIDENCGGSLFALCGVSLGGQIVIELLSRKPDLAKKAIIDGSVCYPNPAMARFSIAVVKYFGWMMFSKTACRFQIAVMNNFFPKKMRFSKELTEHYLRDMPRVRKETLYAIYRTYMIEYNLKDSVRRTTAQVMYWYGEREMKCVKKSAQMFRALVPGCEIYEAKGCDHGYLSIYLPDEWLKIAEPFFNEG